MKKYDIELDLVTPCISRGGEEDNAEFRAPSIRGMLRHWFRVLGGTKEREKDIFGGIGTGKGKEQASKIIVRVTESPKECAQGTPQEIAPKNFNYFLGLWTRNDPKAYFPANQTARIQIIDKSDSPDFEAALKAFLYLGSLGSRSRRTFGSIYPKKVLCNGDEWTDIPRTLDELKAYLGGSGLKNAVVLSIGDMKNSSEKAVECASEFLKSFRCGKACNGSTPLKWGKIEHDLIDPGKQTDKVFRPALGLPLLQRYSKDRGSFSFSFRLDSGEKPGNYNRWASPLYLKVVPVDNKFVALAIFLKDFFPPTEGCTVLRKEKPFKLSHELIEAMMVPTDDRKQLFP